ncbi:MAG: class I SAM-dependent methyltransferase [bacterium]|nr:class I SAM-dependent methyltransferase [bacterium]
MDRAGRVTYSPRFIARIRELHRGMEGWPHYARYIEEHLGGPDSRVVRFTERLLPEIEFFCGPLDSKRVLDFGCGTGASTVALACRAGGVHAYDIDREALDICRLRLSEHGLADRVAFPDAPEGAGGGYDLILLSGVVEHIPLSEAGLRRDVLRRVFGLLAPNGCLYITETPNRLWPFDFHTTGLAGIPWTRPGSPWAHLRAVRRGRYSPTERLSPGPRGLEEAGAWGSTWWEIKGCLRGLPWLSVNLLPGHDRHVHIPPVGLLKRFAESLVYFSFTRPLGVPITAFTPFINNLVLQRSG